MPTRSTASEFSLPDRFSGFRKFPQAKIAGVSFCNTLINAAYFVTGFLRSSVGKFSVIAEGREIKIPTTRPGFPRARRVIFNFIGISFFNQSFHLMYDLFNVVSGARKLSNRGNVQVF